MRTLFAAAIALPALLAADLALSIAGPGATEAHAADFTGRVRRIRIRENNSAQNNFRIIANTTSGSVAAATSKQFVDIDLQPLDGGPELSPLHLDAPKSSDIRSNTVLKVADGKYLVRTTLKSPDGKIDVATSKEPVVFGAEDQDWSDAFKTERFQVSTRVDVLPDGHVLWVSAKPDDGSAATYGSAYVELIDPATGKIATAADTQVEAVHQRWAAAVEGDDLTGFSYAYTANFIGDGSTIDIVGGNLEFGDDASTSTFDRVVLTTDKLGHAKVVARVSTPDTAPVVIETLVTDLATGTVLLDVAAGSPAWVERHYQGAQVRLGLADEVYSVGASATGFSNGKPVAGPFDVTVPARHYSAEDTALDTAVFDEGFGQIALVPASAEDFHFVVHYAGEQASSITSWQIELAKPLPGSDETSFSVPFSEAWMQFAERADAPVSEGGAAFLELNLTDQDAELLDQISALEAEGVAYKTGDGPDEIEVFLRTIIGTEGMRTTTLRASRTTRR